MKSFAVYFSGLLLENRTQCENTTHEMAKEYKVILMEKFN